MFKYSNDNILNLVCWIEIISTAMQSGKIHFTFSTKQINLMVISSVPDQVNECVKQFTIPPDYCLPPTCLSIMIIPLTSLLVSACDHERAAGPLLGRKGLLVPRKEYGISGSECSLHARGQPFDNLGRAGVFCLPILFFPPSVEANTFFTF